MATTWRIGRLEKTLQASAATSILMAWRFLVLYFVRFQIYVGKGDIKAAFVFQMTSCYIVREDSNHTSPCLPPIHTDGSQLSSPLNAQYARIVNAFRPSGSFKDTDSSTALKKALHPSEGALGWVTMDLYVEKRDAAPRHASHGQPRSGPDFLFRKYLK